jgi:hypothetical protein
MTDKEALELALVTLESDNLKIGNIYVNYDIQKALIKLVKKALDEERKKKEWQGLTDEEVWDVCKTLKAANLYPAIEAKLREKNNG